MLGDLKEARTRTVDSVWGVVRPEVFLPRVPVAETLCPNPYAGIF